MRNALKRSSNVASTETDSGLQTVSAWKLFWRIVFREFVFRISFLAIGVWKTNQNNRNQMSKTKFDEKMKEEL